MNLPLSHCQQLQFLLHFTHIFSFRLACCPWPTTQDFLFSLLLTNFAVAGSPHQIFFILHHWQKSPLLTTSFFLIFTNLHYRHFFYYSLQKCFSKLKSCNDTRKKSQNCIATLASDEERMVVDFVIQVGFVIHAC